MPEIRFKFDRHGLGDCVHAGHLLQLYRARGYEITIQCEENKRLVWEAAGCTISDRRGLQDHNWGYPAQFENLDQPDCLGNKAAHNIGHPPLPPIEGDRQSLWDELCGVRLSVDHLISQEARDAAAQFLDGLPKPIICLHASGTNWRERKSIPPAVSFGLILELIRITGGSVVSLDWDHRDPIVAHPRCKPIWTSWGKINLERLAALYAMADLMIGIDSGPFHFAAMTDVPALGVFRTLQPVRCCLPSPRAEYLVTDKYREAWESPDRKDRWNLRQYHGDEPTVADIVSVAAAMLHCVTKTQPRKPQMDLTPYAGKWIYERVGHDARTMHLEPSGVISEGSGSCERRWTVRLDAGTPTIDILGDEGVICSCRQDGAVWSGRWTKFERMPITLVRVTPPADAAGPDPDSPAAKYNLDLIGESEHQIELTATGGVNGWDRADQWRMVNSYLTLSLGNSPVCVLHQDSDDVYRGKIPGRDREITVEMIAAARQPFRSIGKTEPIEHQAGRYRYVTAAQFAADCFAFARELPPVKAIAGVPRSGLLAASLMAGELNCPMIPIESLMTRDIPVIPVPRRGTGVRYPSDGLILVVDDSCSSGRVIARLRERLHPDVKIAVIDGNDTADLFYRRADPTLHTSYEWTLLHDSNAEWTLCDMDGVLCEDWTGGNEDDNPAAYEEFLEMAHTLRVPSYPILAVVTNRIERYRPQTEEWLKRHGVQYQHLIMAPYQTAAERNTQAGNPAVFKASAYRNFPEARLFIESCDKQAAEIFLRSDRRPVLSYTDNLLLSLNEK